MAEKPIVFDTQKVWALLDGKKTQERRVMKSKDWFNRPLNLDDADKIEMQWTTNRTQFRGNMLCKHGEFVSNIKPPHKPGNILWVKEKWLRLDSCKYCMCDNEPGDQSGCYLYYATHGDAEGLIWRNPCYMPRAAARIFLRVTDVRVERVQEITEDDAIAEGVPCDWPMEPIYCPSCNGKGLTGAFHPGTLGYMEIDCPHCEKAAVRYKNLWDSLNAKHGYGWDVNPWVWVVEFERVDDK